MRVYYWGRVGFARVGSDGVPLIEWTDGRVWRATDQTHSGWEIWR